MLILISAICLSLFTILAYKNLKHALFVLPLLLPSYLIRFSIGPIPFTLLEGFILIIIFWGVFNRKKTGSFINPRFKKPIILFVLASILGVLAAQDTLSALGIWKAYFIEPILFFFILGKTFTTKNDWGKMYLSLGASAALFGAVGIVQYIFQIGIPAPWDIERRVTSVFDYPNALGLFLAPITTVAILSFCSSKRYLKPFWLIVAFLSLGGIILAKTEAALVAIPAATIATLLISNTENRKKIFLIILSGALLVGALAFGPARQKLFLQDYSGQVRISQWKETTKLIADNPIFGAGLNTYPSAIIPYHDFGIFEIFQYPHNIVFNIWVELGVLGVIAFFYLAIEAVRVVRKNKDDQVILVAFAALLTMTVHGFVDVPYFKNDLAILTWIFFAAICFELQKKNKQNNTQYNEKSTK